MFSASVYGVEVNNSNEKHRQRRSKMDSTTAILYKNTLMNIAHRTPCSEIKDGKKMANCNLNRRAALFNHKTPPNFTAEDFF